MRGFKMFRTLALLVFVCVLMVQTIHPAASQSSTELCAKACHKKAMAVYNEALTVFHETEEEAQEAGDFAWAACMAEWCSFQ